MVIKLYIDYNSQPSRAVLAFCLIAKIPFEIIEVSMFSGDVPFLSCSYENQSMPRSTR